jgi:hypothetical protein
MDDDMNKWYFSQNGTVTEPMDFESAKEFVVANPNAYGWQQSYTQWLPIHCISEFADITPPFKPLAEIPQSVVDEFNGKAQNLVEKLEEVNIDIANNEQFSNEFAQEIEAYKKITQQLSPEVQANINSIEEQYTLLQGKLEAIKQHTHSSANEISKVVADFDLRIANKSVSSLAVETNKTPVKEISKPVKTTKTVNIANVTKEVIQEPVINIPESAIKVPENTEVVNTRPPRPAGAKVISTRSKKPAGAKTISTVNTNVVKTQAEPTQANDTQKNKPANNQQAEVRASVKPAIVKAEPLIKAEPVKNAPVKMEAAKKEPSTPSKSAIETDKIKEKIGTGVKNIFNSMFSTESPTPSISAQLKDLAAQKDDVAEKIKDDVK